MDSIRYNRYGKRKDTTRSAPFNGTWEMTLTLASRQFPAASYSPDADLEAIAEALEYIDSLPVNYDRAERIRRYGIASEEALEDMNRISEADYGRTGRGQLR